MGKKRASIGSRNALGVILWIIIGTIILFDATKATWFDHIARDNKALFWANVATALGTIGLCAVAVVSALVAYTQYKGFVRDSRTRATMEVLKEWSADDFHELISFTDKCLSDWIYEPRQNREFARRLYRLVNQTKVEKRSDENREIWRERKRRILARRARVSDGIETIALMASRTWNLLDAELIDKNVLFNQIDFYVLSMYFELEDVLAIRQVEDEQLYADFTRLARAAQKHYKHHQDREVVEHFVEAQFDDLPFEYDELEVYMNKVKAREAEFWRTVEKDTEVEVEDIA